MNRWILHLQSQPSNVPESTRMRLVLKRLLRTYGFRCVNIQREGTESNGEERSGDGMTDDSSEPQSCGSVAQNASNGISPDCEVF